MTAKGTVTCTYPKGEGDAFSHDESRSRGHRLLYGLSSFRDHQADQTPIEGREAALQQFTDWLVPTMEVARFLFGVSVDPDDPVTTFRQRLTNLPELAEALRSRGIAQQIIREAQKNMVGKDCDFYQNVRHWVVPKNAVDQILFGNSKEEY